MNKIKQKSKQILSLFLIVLMLIPLTITTSIVSKAYKQVIASDDWYIYDWSYNTNNVIYDGYFELGHSIDSLGATYVASDLVSGWKHYSAMLKQAGSTKPGGAAIKFKNSTSVTGAGTYNTDSNGYGRFYVGFMMSSGNSGTSIAVNLLNSITATSNTSVIYPGNCLYVCFYNVGSNYTCNTYYKNYIAINDSTNIASGDSVVAYTNGTEQTLSLKRTGGDNSYNGTGLYSLYLDTTLLATNISLNNNLNLFPFIVNTPMPSYMNLVSGFIGNPSCSVTGVKSCGSSYTVTDMTTTRDHNWGTEITTDATYTTKGSKTKTCQDSNCGVTYSTEIDYLTQNITLAVGNNAATSGAATIKYQDSSATITAATSGNTGYKLDGYYTAASGGTKVLDASGNCIAGVSGYTDSNGKWIGSNATTTLYAQYSLAGVYLKYSSNGGYWDGISDTANKLNQTAGGIINDGDNYSFPTYTSLKKSGYHLHTHDNNLLQPAFFTADGNGNGLFPNLYNGYGYGCYNNGFNDYHINFAACGLSIGDSATLYAVWDPIITYNMNDGAGTYVQDYFSVLNSSYTILGIGDETNYSSGSSTDKLGFVQTAYGDNTITSHSLLQNLDGYDGPVKIPTRTGYTFLGWATTQNGSVTYSAGASLSLTEPLTLYAVWEPITYTVTFDANGGTCSTSSVQKNYGATLGTLPTPTLQYYTFDGWYTALSGGTQITADTTVTANVTYYAHWTHITTLTVNPGSDSATFTLTIGENTTSYTGTQTFSYDFGTDIVLTFTSNENFGAWINSSNKVVSADKEYHFILGSITTLTAEISDAGDKDSTTSALVIYESYDKQVISSERYETTDSIVPPSAPSRMGYTFECWSLTESEIITEMGTQTVVVVTAQYTQNTQDVTINLYYVNTSGDTLKESVCATYKVGQGFTVYAPDIDGYTFNYWSKDSKDGTKLSYLPNYSYRSMETEINLYCVFGTEQATVEPILSTPTVSASMNGSKYRVTFSSSIAVPAGYTVVERGIVYALSEQNCVVDASGSAKYVGQYTSRVGTITLNINTTIASRTYYAKSYVIVENSSGKIETFYSGVSSGSYNTISK